MSKLRAGELVLPQERFELRPLIDEVAEAMRSTHSTLQITVSCDAGLVRGSRLHLSQVLKNLASNACKFTSRKFAAMADGGGEGGGGIVRIAALRVDMADWVSSLSP